MKYNHINIAAFLESSSSGDVWKVMIIEEGLSKNGKYYTQEALTKSINLFEKSKVCFYEWQDKHYDHLPLSIEEMRPEGFPLQTAGFLDNVKFETVKVEGREVTGLTGSLHLLTTNSKVKNLKQMLTNAWQKGLKNLLGLSINAEGPSSVRMLNGQPVTVVDSITKVFSTDFVSQPAAGGGLLKMIESINLKGGNEKMFKKILEAVKRWNPKLLESVDIANITEVEVTSIFESLVKTAKESNSNKTKELEAIVAKFKEKDYSEAETLLNALISMKEMTDKELLAADDSNLDPKNLKKKKDLLKKQAEAKDKTDQDVKNTDLEKRNKDLEAKLDGISSKLAVKECKDMLELALAESNLPDVIKNKIRSSFKNKVFKEADMKESIKSERTVLAKLVESNTIIDFGIDIGEGSFVAREPVTRLQASLDLMLGYKPEDSEKDNYKDIGGFRSLKEAYVAYTDDAEVTGRMGAKALARLSEAVVDDNSSFAYALGYSMQRRMLPEYRAIPEHWKEIATAVAIKDFKLQERIQWGGFGVLPTVQAARTVAGTPIDSASPTYPELGFPPDQEATYAVATKGGMVTVTRRSIIDDDLKVLSGIPKRVGKAAGYTLNQFVFDLMIGYGASGINTATIYDSAVLYIAAHKNYRTGALGFDNLQDLLNDMWYQCELGYKTDVATQLEAAATELDVTGGTGQYFKAGDYAWIDGEIVRIDSVSTDALTIARGMFGTTDAQHVVAIDVRKVTQFLALEKPTLWVPRSLNGTALSLQNSDKNPETAEGGINTLKGQFETKQSPFLRGDENNYYLTAKKSDVEGIEVGFLNGKEEPEILVQDQPTAGNVFVYDTIRYKVRHEYGGAVVDFRAFAGAIVS